MEFMQIPRSQNMEADEVSRLASSEGGEIITELAMEVQKIGRASCRERV